MRKKDENKRKKGQETTIGKIIYGFLLFMPLLTIVTTCLISTFNMSAKEETEIHYKYKTNEVNSWNDLIQGNIYNINIRSPEHLNNFVLGGKVLNFNYYYIEDFVANTDETYFEDEEIINNLTSFNLSCYHGVLNFYLYYPTDNNYVGTYIEAQEDSFINLNFDFIYIEHTNTTDFVVNRFEIKESTFNEIESVETHNLNAEDIFYHSVDKVTESPLFNWAENSIIYTTTNATCNALSITTPFIPLLLSYWLIISVIYFLYDIALMLVWMIHRKIHELQESL